MGNRGISNSEPQNQEVNPVSNFFMIQYSIFHGFLPNDR